MADDTPKKAKSPYEVLGVAPDANKQAIKDAYRSLAKVYHPDVKGGTTSGFLTIKRAYELLSDDKRRKVYDAMHKAVLESEKVIEQGTGLNLGGGWPASSGSSWAVYTQPSTNSGSGSTSYPSGGGGWSTYSGNINSAFSQVLNSMKSLQWYPTRPKRSFVIPRNRIHTISQHTIHATYANGIVDELEAVIDFSGVPDLPAPGDEVGLEFSVAMGNGVVQFEAIRVSYGLSANMDLIGTLTLIKKGATTWTP